MLVVMLTAMYIMVRTAESLGVRWAGPDPLPYLVSQPLPWQVHSVSRNRRRRSTRADEFDGRRNSLGVFKKNVFSNVATATLAIPCLLTCPDSSAANGQCTGPLSPCSVDQAASTIQSQYRKYQQKKRKECK